MNQIKVLSEEVTNRIAAGEVIERPASVVKELVENSLDAGSDKISIIIENGGKKLIKIIDNGSGMNEQDVLLAFERHATSKIRNVEDIFNIETLGFRGEALPSIASISKLELTTRKRDDELATQLIIDSGRIVNVKKCSANPGTTITVNQIFSKIPARRNFLKSDQVEFKHILNYLHYQTIVFPNINFKFVSNGKLRLNYQIVDSVEQRLATIFGSEFLAQDMIEIKTEANKLRLYGYISGLEESSKMVQDYRYVFVNNRFIRDKIIVHAINSAYEPFLKKVKSFSEKGRTPPYIIFLFVEPQLVDFNVHPAKLELRFRDSQLVHNFVYSNISRFLEQYEEEKFQTAKHKFTQASVNHDLTSFERKVLTEENKQQFQRRSTERFSSFQDDLKKIYQTDLFKKEPPSESNRGSEDLVDFLIKPEEDIINPWQVHDSYILIQVEDGLLIIDQHAAHERILYEKMLHRIHGTPATTQKLIFPIVVNIPPYYIETLEELISGHQDDLASMGFRVKSFSGNSIVIEEIPSELEEWQGGEQFVEILKQLEEEKAINNDYHDCMAKSVSCKAAIKFGKTLSKKEMVNLINELFSCEIPYFCPHGRPAMIKIALREFEKRFKRIE